MYAPMIITVSISLCLLGSAWFVGGSFESVVDHEMSKYGANVILQPEPGSDIGEGVPVEVHQTLYRGHYVQAATAPLGQLLTQNPAWLVRGNGDLLAGREVAESLGFQPGETVSFRNEEHEIAILESGTEFDSFLLRNGEVTNPTMVLIRTDHPDQYRGANAVILKEMVQSKFQVISAIQRLMLSVAIISAIAAVATVINLARVDAANRRSEFGIFKALGAGQRTVFKLVSAEFGLLAILSAGLGLAGSLGLAYGIIYHLSGTAPEVDITGIFIVFFTTGAAYATAGGLYHLESKRQHVIRELQGE